MRTTTLNLSIVIPVSDAATRFVSVYGAKSSHVTIKKLITKKVDVNSSSVQQLLWVLDHMGHLDASKSAYVLKNFNESKATLAALCGGEVIGYKLSSSQDEVIRNFFMLLLICNQASIFQFDYFDWMGSLLRKIDEYKVFNFGEEILRFENDAFFHAELLNLSRNKIREEFFSAIKVKLTADS